jgi:hypothetical protein
VESNFPRWLPFDLFRLDVRIVGYGNSRILELISSIRRVLMLLNSPLDGLYGG